MVRGDRGQDARYQLHGRPDATAVAFPHTFYPRYLALFFALFLRYFASDSGRFTLSSALAFRAAKERP